MIKLELWIAQLIGSDKLTSAGGPKIIKVSNREEVLKQKYNGNY